MQIKDYPFLTLGFKNIIGMRETSYTTISYRKQAVFRGIEH